MKVDGERWQARVVGGGPVDPGETVRVVSLEGLTLLVERADRASA